MAFTMQQDDVAHAHAAARLQVQLQELELVLILFLVLVLVLAYPRRCAPWRTRWQTTAACTTHTACTLRRWAAHCRQALRPAGGPAANR